MNVSVDIAAAITATLNAQTFNQAFVATTEYRPAYLETDTTLKIFVIPGEVTYTPNSRATKQEDHTIALGIFKRIEITDQTSLSNMFTFTQQVIDFIKLPPGELNKYDGSNDAVLVKFANPVAYDANILDQQGVFHSVITATYAVSR